MPTTAPANTGRPGSELTTELADRDREMRHGSTYVIDVGKEWAKRVVRDDVFGLAAELAYWFFLSLFPFFIFLAALGGFVAATLDVRDPTQQIVDLLGTTMPPEATLLA